MANRRMISGDIFEDEFVGTLSYFERLQWIGMITSVADDQGRILDNPAIIRSKVFLFDFTNDSEVDTTTAKIAQAGKIVRYVAGGKALIQIVNWWKYQTPAWASPSKYPPPPGWIDRAKYHAAGNKIVVLNWDNVGGYVAGYVPGQDRTIEEGDVKGDVKGEGEEEAPPDLFDAIRIAVEQRGIILTGEADQTAIREIIDMGANVDDVISGLSWKITNNKGKPVRYMASVVGPTRTAMQIRLQNSNGHKPDKPPEEVFGDQVFR